MKLIKTLIILLIFSLFNCRSKEQKVVANNNLDKDIIGEWRNVYLKITINTVGNTPETKVMEADSSDWEEVLHIKPIRTYFNPNGTYRSAYYTAKDSLFMTNTGTWQISDDSLTMEEISPRSTKLKFKLRINNGLAVFDGMLDFDGDHQADDHYFGKQRKQ